MEFKIFENCFEISHHISTRSNGYSLNNYKSLNLAYHVADQKDNVDKNREIVSKKLGVQVSELLFPNQTHSSHVQVIQNKDDLAKKFEATDALITNIKGICIGILTADCVPILLYDTEKHVIAAIHAGWRGTVGKIVENTVNKMIEVFETNPQNILAGIGPCISKEIYEISSDLAHDIENKLSEYQDIVLLKNEKYYFDLVKSNVLQLKKMKVPEMQIETMNICTFQSQDLFFSARRDGFSTGRFGTCIKLKD